jgi:hypothetical protein
MLSFFIRLPCVPRKTVCARTGKRKRKMQNAKCFARRFDCRTAAMQR